MACDLGQQKPPSPWQAADVGALEQPRLRLILDAPGRERASRRRLHVASRGAVVLVAMLRLRRRALAEDEEQVDGVAEHALERTAKGSSEETTVPDTALLLPSSAAAAAAKGNFSKGTSSTQEQRGQVVISSMDNSTVDLLSYLQHPKAVRLLEEKSREIWEVPCEDGVEECVTALAMLLPIVEEKISAPVTVVVEGISTKRSSYHVTVMLQLSGSLRTAWLLLKNMSRISVGCLPFSAHSASKSDYRYPISPLTANISEDSHDTENQQLDQCSESNIVESQQGNECRLTSVDSHQVGDSADNDSSVMPIFVRHVSGKLTLTVSLDQSSQHLMHLYAQKTKTKLECQYFVYRRKTLEPDHTLLFYGLERNTTVHVCTRLLGGKFTTLAQYVNDNSNTFTVEVTLPDGRISLQMTTKGCQFLSSWINCFTTAFARGQSMNGKFTLDDFKYVEGHIRNIKLPKANCPPGSMANDLITFLGHVEHILCSRKPNLISKYPPYLKQFIHFANSIIPPLNVTNVLSSEDKLFLETHICCMTCYARERLIIGLFRKYDGLDVNEASDWKEAINGASCAVTWLSDLPTKSPFFEYLIEKGKNKGVKYAKSRTSAFVFIKDTVLHATDHDKNANAPQLGDGIELMIPAYLEDFLPTIILNLIKKKVDINAELLAAIRCACRMCDSSH